VWRYVSAMHRRFEDSPVTEDDINEVKGEISAMRYELLEIFDKSGMDVSSVDRKEKSKEKIFFISIPFTARIMSHYFNLPT
jgi:transient-receptor-potential-like protein